MRISPVSTSFRSIPSPMMPSTLVLVGPTSVGFKYSRESSVKLAIRSSLGGSSDSRKPGEGYLQVVSVRAHSGYMHSLPWLTRPDDYGPGCEIEWYAQHVGVLDVELVILVQVVGLATERSSDHLLAQKLCAEGPYTQGRG